jgi:hypothetical protein
LRVVFFIKQKSHLAKIGIPAKRDGTTLVPLLVVSSETLITLYRAYPPGLKGYPSGRELRGEFETLLAAGSHHPGSLIASAKSLLLPVNANIDYVETVTELIMSCQCG